METIQEMVEYVQGYVDMGHPCPVCGEPMRMITNWRLDASWEVIPVCYSCKKAYKEYKHGYRQGREAKLG